MSRFRHIASALGLYSRLVTAIAIFGAVIVLEELDAKPGDLVGYKCPECGRQREVTFVIGEYPHCDTSDKGRNHQTREMMLFSIIKRA